MSANPRQQHGFYYVQVDENGVTCVDQLFIERREDAEKETAKLARVYPNVIYFQHEAEPVSGNDQVLAALAEIKAAVDHLVDRIG